MDSIESRLQGIVNGEGLGGFAVIYSDMHGLWGGTTASVDGSGRVEIASREAGGEVLTRRGAIEGEDVRALARLLLDIRAWEQRTPEAIPVPDESRATLTVRCGGETSVIWERYNELAANARISLVRNHFVSLGVRATGTVE